MKFISIGFGSYAQADRILAVISPDSAPIRRKVQEARDAGHLIDATYGRKMRSVLQMDNGTLICVAVAPDTIAERIGEGK